tara:strand:+ start:195 stop:554 length:360 start_codon:yes stop_codon:yes gene_type:complete
MTIPIQYVVLVCLLFLISLIINAVLIWYARNSIIQLAFISDNLNDLRNSVSVYAKHLRNVYELEMFYGDETLGALMQHTTELEASLELYEDFYDLFETEDGVTEVMVEEEEEIDAAPQT